MEHHLKPIKNPWTPLVSPSLGKQIQTPGTQVVEVRSAGEPEAFFEPGEIWVGNPILVAGFNMIFWIFMMYTIYIYKLYKWPYIDITYIYKDL